MYDLAVFHFTLKAPQSDKKTIFGQVISVEIATTCSRSTFTPAAQSAVLFSLVCEILQRQMHVANLTAIFCKARQEPLECKRRGMSRCATLSLRQAKPLHSSAKWDCAVCQKRSHSFFGHTGWHKFTRKTSTLRSTPFVQRYFFLLKGQARIKGIFITYEWFDLSFFQTCHGAFNWHSCCVWGDRWWRVKKHFPSPSSSLFFHPLPPPVSLCKPQLSIWSPISGYIQAHWTLHLLSLSVAPLFPRPRIAPISLFSTYHLPLTLSPPYLTISAFCLIFSTPLCIFIASLLSLAFLAGSV